MQNPRIYIYKGDLYIKETDNMITQYFWIPDGSYKRELCKKEAYEQAEYYGKLYFKRAKIKQKEIAA
jgi:hypothetical protein